jgi:ribosomal protein L22
VFRDFGTKMSSDKIRLVYDLLDARQYKDALKTVNNVLEKKKDNALMRSLKLLTLIRMGKLNEIEPLIAEFKTGKGIDEYTYNTLQLALRECGRSQLSVMCPDPCRQ